jgi:hypothetical protein
MTNQSVVRAYVDNHQEDAARIVVTNTPEGMLAAAALLTESDSDRHELQNLAQLFEQGTSWTDTQKQIVDIILAAVSVDDQGKLQPHLDMEGWPLALAALTGDTTARLIIDTKREGLVNAERVRASDPTLVEEAVAYQAEHGYKSSEPIPLEQLALVHSTSYDIQRDDDGDIILRTAGQQRDDKYPRASVHFTLNSRVGDVMSNAQHKAWSEANRLIVANLKSTIDRFRRLPNRMAGMDTWFMLNPGEALKLPGALVVEQVEQTASGEVIEETENGIQYVQKDVYSDHDRHFLMELSNKYGVGGPKDIALHMAMERVGVPVDLMDDISTDGHTMASHALGSRVNATARSLGLPSGEHFQTPEAYMEDEAYANMPKLVGKQTHDPYSLRTAYMSSYSGTAIEARRQALASGFYPARPNIADESTIERYKNRRGI